MATTDLNQKQRSQLLSILRELDPTAPAENRRHSRRKVLKALWIRQFNKTGDGPARKILLENVAKKGVGFLAHKPLEKGDKFLLPLDFEDGTGWTVLCEVRNCRKLSNGQYSVGARFIDQIERNGDTVQVPADWRTY